MFLMVDLNGGCVIDVDFDMNLSEPNLYSIPFEENFEDGMPCDWDNSSNWTFESLRMLKGLIGRFQNIINLRCLMMMLVIVI